MGLNYHVTAATKADVLAQIDADVALNSTLPKDGSLQDAARGLMKLVGDGPMHVSLYGHVTETGEGVLQVSLRRSDAIKVTPDEIPAPAAGAPVAVPH